MEPQVRYARAKDGTNIAYWVLGEGVSLVAMPPSPGHIQLEWEDPDYRRWYSRQAQTHRLIRYDMRGTGLSDRDVPDVSLEGVMSDIDAVVDALGLATFALTGISLSGPQAIAYAARHADRVSHLMLWCSYAAAADFTLPQLDALAAMIDSDWELFTETMSHAMVAGWAQGDEARRYAALTRAAITPDRFQAFRKEAMGLDARHLLPRVQAPTLVAHRRDVPWPPIDAAKALAAGIPNARLVLLEGTSPLPWVGDMEAVARMAEEFLGIESPQPPIPVALTAASGLAIILFTDIEDSTGLGQRLGDARAQEVRRAHNDVVRSALNQHGGSEIKHTGDGIMASFPTASLALECAVAIQRAVALRQAQGGQAEPIEALAVHIGLNAGEPIAEEQDLFGTAVDLARRICDHAEAGDILVSNVVRELAAGKSFLFADRGEAALRGFDDPVRLYEVRWRQ
jgi:class 3 adenylate cyclase